MVGTLSGPDAWRGEDAYEGADLGVQILNRGPGDDFELVTRDDGGDPAQAMEEISAFAASERTVGIVYAGPPEVLPEAEEVLADAGIPALLCYGDLYSARALSPHVFQVSPPMLWQARRMARYIARDRRYEKVGVMVERSDEGAAAADAVATAVADVGANVSSVNYAYQEDSITTVLQELRQDHVEVLILQGSPATVRVTTRRGPRDESDLRGHAGRAHLFCPRRVARRRQRSDYWQPQVIGFDLAIAPGRTRLRPGTVAADAYSRGAHFLPVPELRAFPGCVRQLVGLGAARLGAPGVRGDQPDRLSGPDGQGRTRTSHSPWSGSEAGGSGGSM